jgi:ABC-type multidrug transport system fused ATPase/permease subunit
VISVTHRLASAANADRVIVFEHGRICASGSHVELMQREGFYASFWSKQQDVHDEFAAG